MKSKHLTYFKVEGFKLFKSLELQNIEHINLIIGDNNTGKSSLLEALLFNENIRLFNIHLVKVLFEYRNLEKIRDLFLDYFLHRHINFISDHISFSVEYNHEALAVYHLKRNNHDNFFTVDNSNCSLPYNTPTETLAKQIIPYIPSHAVYQNDLVELYSQYIQGSRTRKQALLKALGNIIPDIESIDISTTTAEYPTLVIMQQQIDSALPLAMFGDGVIKLFRILIMLFVNSNSRVMIDAFDAGIHPFRCGKFWQTITQTAKNENVQLFIVFQNPISLTYIQEAVENTSSILKKTDIRLYCLAFDQEKSVVVHSYKYENIQTIVQKNTKYYE